MTRVRSIDDLINSVPEAQPINSANSPVERKEVEQKVESPEPDANLTEDNANNDDSKKQENSTKDDNVQENAGNVQDDESHKSKPADTDEYGNPVAKPKMYSEEEVQRMIRDRLKRGTFRQEQEQPTQQQVQQAQNSGFEYNENSDESWQQQLKTFVKSTMQEVQQENIQHQQVQQQKATQTAFEEKFFDGMAKHPDFVQELSDKTITNDMMMGIRGLDNPAGFLYAAAKREPKELERISRIPDPYQQSAEMGRLHERMRKAKTSSNAPRPVSQDRGDIADKAPQKVSIDHLIQEDAVKRIRR